MLVALCSESSLGFHYGYFGVEANLWDSFVGHCSSVTCLDNC